MKTFAYVSAADVYTVLQSITLRVAGEVHRRRHQPRRLDA
jgi:hypothetical protein